MLHVSEGNRTRWKRGIMKVVVNLALCDGNGNCAKAAPEIFAMNDDDTLKILQETFGDDLRQKAETAVRSCPKNALSLTD